MRKLRRVLPFLLTLLLILTSVHYRTPIKAEDMIDDSVQELVDEPEEENTETPLEAEEVEVVVDAVDTLDEEDIDEPIIEETEEPLVIEEAFEVEDSIEIEDSMDEVEDEENPLSLEEEPIVETSDMGTFGFGLMNTEADGVFYSQPGAMVLDVVLDASSINTHTVPQMLWVNGNTLYFAIKSTHKLQYIDIGETPLRYYNTAANAIEFAQKKHIQVDDVDYDPAYGLSGNTGNARWTVFKIPLADLALELKDNHNNIFIKGIGGGHDVSGTFTIIIPYVTATATKEWVDGPKTPVDVQLQRRNRDMYTGDEAGWENVGAPVTLKNVPGENTYTWETLEYTDVTGRIYEYRIKESNPGQGYTVEFISNYVEYETPTAGGVIGVYTWTLINTYTSPKVNITATKVWVGGPNQGEEVTLQLLQNGSAYGAPVTTTNLSYTWENVPETDYDGVAYTYTLQELDPVDNYTIVITGDVTEGFTITNTYASPLIGVTASKEWVGGAAHPSVEFQLQRDGVDHGDPVTIGEADGWTYTWSGLPLTDDDGVHYTYTVVEVNVPENYTPSYETTTDDEGNVSVVVTNTYASPKIDITVEKTWVDGPDVKPEITIHLLRDGEVVDTVVLKDGETTHTFIDLDKTDFDGNEYEYTIEEETVEGYESLIKDYSVTNTFITEKIDIEITKVWVNGPAVKPTISIQLYQDGVAYGEPVELPNGTTKYTFTGLDKTNRKGEVHEYTVEELEVEHYDSVVDGFVITNTYVVEKIDIEVTKVWVNAPEVKPTIEIQLYRNGEKHLDPVKLVDGETTYVFKDLEKTDLEGKEYTYHVEEITKIEDVTVTVEDFVITNTYKKKLPHTGSTHYNPLISLLFVSAGAYLVLRKREEEEER